MSGRRWRLYIPLAGALAGALGCTAPPAPEPTQTPVDPSSTDEVAAADPVETASEGPELAMKTVHFAEADLDLRLLDLPHGTHAWDEGGVISQYVRLEEDHQLRIVVRVGEGEDLSHVKEFRPSDTFGPFTDATLCGRPARRLEGHSPSRDIDCIEFADGTPSRPGFDPAQTTILLEFEHDGMGATAEWSVPTRYRELYRELEDEFFSHLGCVD